MEPTDLTIETLKGGIFTYDGKGALKAVPHSSAAEIGAYPKVYELAGQDNKVVVLTISGPVAMRLTGEKSLTTSYGTALLRNGVVTWIDAVSISV